MAKHTPFFKFDSAAWLGGSIQFTDLESKGLFIDLCALYWESQKPIKIDTKFKVRTRCPEGTLNKIIGTLSDLDIIVQTEHGITIPFLDSLMSDREVWLKKCSESGKKSATNKGTPSNKKEERRKKSVDSRKKNKEKDKKDCETFEAFRNIYPGTKKGFDIEFVNFWKKHKDWELVLPDLSAILKCQIEQRAALKFDGQFVPPWKHLSTWINNRCWEEEFAKPEEPAHKSLEHIESIDVYVDREKQIVYDSAGNVSSEYAFFDNQVSVV
jgi:hypothetical protein